jgi:hypothetical protein
MGRRYCTAIARDFLPMSIWAKRYFLDTSYLDCHELMLRQSREGVMGLSMVATPGSGDDFTKPTIYISLPESELLANYSGFEEISESALPEEAVLIYGDREEFKARFKYHRA